MILELDTLQATLPAVQAAPEHPQCDFTARARGAALERHAFCREVQRLVTAGATTAQAVAAVATRIELFPLLASAGKHNSCALTVANYRNWMRRLGRHANGRPDWENVQALADRYGMQVRGRAGVPEFWQLIAKFYLNENKLALAEAYRLTATGLRHAGFDSTAMPTLDQVRYWFETKADQAAVLTARHGLDFARNAIAGYILRDWSQVSPNDMWYGDHHQFDSPCRIFEEDAAEWQACRPWLTAWMDAKSQYFTGWVIRAGEHPDSLAIEDALLHGIRAADNVPPGILAIDNGKDYCSLGFLEPIEFDGQKHSIAGEIGCRYTTALPYNARAKTIERMFRNVAASFSKWLPGYRGNCPENRPENAQEVWENPLRLPTLQQFCEAFAYWLHEYYHALPGESQITGGKAPGDVWASRSEPVRRLTDEDLFFGFLKPLTTLRTVGRGCMLRVCNQVFQSEQLWPWFNKRVMVKLDRFRPTEHVYAYSPDGKLICEAPRVGMVPAIVGTDQERQLLGEHMAFQRRQITRARTIIADMVGGEKRVGAPLDRLITGAAAGLISADSAAAPAHEYTTASAKTSHLKDTAESAVDHKTRAANVAALEELLRAGPGPGFDAEPTPDTDLDLLANIETGGLI